MSRNRLMMVFGVLMAITMVMTACAPQATATPAPVPTSPSATAAATAAPTAVPAHTGGWLDQVVFSVVDASSAITQLGAGAIDIYAGGLAAADYPNITKAGLNYAESSGLQYSIMYNPATFTDKTVLNPFSDKKIREATNYLYDRNYINQEVYAGADLPKWFAITTQFPAYANVADVAAGLEAQYAYNPDKAKSIISTEMTSLGATQDASGKWQYKGKPVTLNFLIRTDSDGTRKPIGDYVATQLESVGFTVNREYKKSSEASPIWQGDPTTGQWNLYTAAYSATVIDREEKVNFQEYYAPDSIQGTQPFMSNTGIDPAFAKLCDDLANGNYTSLTQRDQMMEQAMPLSMQDSLMVFLIDGKNFVPEAKKVQVSYDLAAGVEGAYVAPFTLRFAGQTGGTMKWGAPDLFTDPWNPIAGSNWAWDQANHNFTDMGEGGLMPDPYTGLAWPIVFDKATVTATQGLPIGKTLDWVTLNFAPTITVPSDAFVDWDAKAQKFITAGEKSTTPITAKIMSTVTYPDDLFNKVTWHDGTNLSVADFLMSMIMTFDRGNKDSAIYDAAYVPLLQSFQQGFVAFRITSTSPLTVEYYANVYAADAELDVATLWPGVPMYLYGEGSWHVLAISNLAEAAGQLAYSDDKATANKTEWTSYVGGPSLDILSKYLDQAIAQKYIPYAPTLGQYITADQAVAAYTNLKNWYTTHGNFWVGTGPYMLDKAAPVEKTATMTRYAAFAYPSDVWSQFSQPKIAVVAVDGPAQVTVGQEGDFTVTVTFNNAPYPSAEIKQVKYLLFDATGAISSTGTATMVSEGSYKIALTSDITSKLTAGADKLEAVVIATPVAIPTFANYQFVTVAP
ncbi:MAG: ABC transporter substrate-binding protein [Anaerolineales bacterium]